jgi:hypothetical protein
MLDINLRQVGNDSIEGYTTCIHELPGSKINNK